MTQKKNEKPNSPPPLRNEDLPVTNGLFQAQKREILVSLSALSEQGTKRDKKIANLEKEMNQRFNHMEQKFDGLEQRFEKRFDNFDERFTRLEQIILRQETRNFEQRAQNNYVLDGYASLHSRVEKVEKRLDERES